MTNTTHTDNRLSFNLELDASWQDMDESMRASMVAQMQDMLQSFRPVKKIDTVRTGKVWTHTADVDGHPVYRRESAEHGVIHVAWDHTLRFTARDAELTPLTEGPNTGIIASGQTAAEVMDLIDAGWDN